MNDRIQQKAQWEEIQHEIQFMLQPGQRLVLDLVPPRTGKVYALSIREGDDFGPYSVITNEGLLALLRSVKGQYFYIYKDFEPIPIFYFEHLQQQQEIEGERQWTRRHW